MKFDFLVDASGEGCPMPLLRAKQQLNKMSVGEILKLISTDSGSAKDIPAFIALTNHKVHASNNDESFVFYIEKG